MSSQPVSAAAPLPASMPAVAAAWQSEMSKATVQAYLAQERQSDVRREYVDGEILAMAGETPTHNRLAGNVYLALENAFAARDCAAYCVGVRLRVTPTQYRYPDVMALCEAARFDDENPPALLNPAVVFEILSPSTQGQDRGDKFLEYR